MGRRQLKRGDRVRCHLREGTITGNIRKDGYYPVRFDDLAYLSPGVQHVLPSHLRLLKIK